MLPLSKQQPPTEGYTHTHTYTSIYTHTRQINQKETYAMFIYVCIHVYVYIYIYTYIYIYMYIWGFKSCFTLNFKLLQDMKCLLSACFLKASSRQASGKRQLSSTPGLQVYKWATWSPKPGLGVVGIPATSAAHSALRLPVILDEGPL